MTYKSGTWGEEAKLRSQSRREYFLNRMRLRREQGLVSPSKPAYIDNQTTYPSRKLGNSGELEASNLIKMEKKSKGPDFYTGKEYIEVKTARPTRTTAKGKTYLRWKAHLKSQRKITNYFFIILRNEDDTTRGVYLIPDDYFGDKTTFSISESSLYKIKQFKYNEKQPDNSITTA